MFLLLRNKNLGLGTTEILSRTPNSAPLLCTPTFQQVIQSLSRFSTCKQANLFSGVWCELIVHAQLKEDIKYQGILNCLHLKLKDHESGHPNQDIHKNNNSGFLFTDLFFRVFCMPLRLVLFTLRTRLFFQRQIRLSYKSMGKGKREKPCQKTNKKKTDALILLV